MAEQERKQTRRDDERQDDETVEETVQLMERLQPKAIIATIGIRLFPDTELRERAGSLAPAWRPGESRPRPILGTLLSACVGGPDQVVVGPGVQGRVLVLEHGGDRFPQFGGAGEIGRLAAPHDVVVGVWVGMDVGDGEDAFGKPS